MSLDLSKTDRSEKAWTDKVNRIMSEIKSFGANTVYFHVRPFSDAIYPSEYYPFSHIISGTQGKNAGYDPLQIAIRSAHKAGLSFHAWINPLRVSTQNTPAALSDKNPVEIWKNDNDTDNDGMTLECNGQVFLDPSYSQVRKLICDGVREIVQNYDIDGVHIDDYFYPTEDTAPDKDEYEAYKSRAGECALSQQEWRMQNINSLICGMYEATHTKKGCLFGISPQCNTDNDKRMGADVMRWCSESGYCDYICPQTYVSVEHPTFPFETFANEWRKMTKKSGVQLLFGLALYKAGSGDDSGTWQSCEDNLKTEVEYIRSIGAGGFALFSYEQLSAESAAKELSCLKQVM